MEERTYLSYQKDQRVVKIPDGCHLSLSYQNLTFEITYLYLGLARVSQTYNNDSRIFVKFYSGNFPRHSEKLIKDETILLLDSGDPNYAHSWKLKIDNLENNISLSLLEYPNLGLNLFSEEEKKGFITYVSSPSYSSELRIKY